MDDYVFGALDNFLCRRWNAPAPRSPNFNVGAENRVLGGAINSGIGAPLPGARTLCPGGRGGGGRKTELETLKEVGSQGGAIIRASTILDASLMSSAFSSPPLSLRPSMLEAHASLWFQSRVAASGRLPQVLCLLLSRASPVPLWPKLALPCDSSLALLVLGASSKSSVFSSSLCLLRPSMIKANARNSLRPPAGCRP